MPTHTGAIVAGVAFVMQFKAVLCLPVVLSALLLQACGGLPTTENTNLASLHLVGPDSQPRFTVDIACAGLDPVSDLQCETVDKAFYEWSCDRKLRLRIVDKDDPVFQKDSATVHPESNPAEAYLVTIRIEPAIEPAFRDAGNGVSQFGSAGTHAGTAGYRAWIRVYSASNGVLGAGTTSVTIPTSQHA